MRTQDDIRQFILEQSEVAGGGSKGALAEWSRGLKKNHAYLHQFIHRKSPKKLDELDRRKLAEMMRVSEALLTAGTDSTLPPQGATPLNIVAPTAADGDMPLYRFVHAGRGSLVLEQIPFERVTRPDYLAKVREPYGVMVDGDSMFPEFRPGWIAEVNPNLAPRKDDTCVFRGENADGGFWATIKVYVRQDETHWHVFQYNPRKAFKIKKADFQEAHVVVGTDRRRR